MTLCFARQATALVLYALQAPGPAFTQGETALRVEIPVPTIDGGQ